MVQHISTADCVAKKRYWTLLLKKVFTVLFRCTPLTVDRGPNCRIFYVLWMEKRNYGKIEQELQLLRQEDVSNLIFQVLQRFTKHLIQYIFNVKKIELAPTM